MRSAKRLDVINERIRFREIDFGLLARFFWRGAQHDARWLARIMREQIFWHALSGDRYRVPGALGDRCAESKGSREWKREMRMCAKMACESSANETAACAAPFVNRLIVVTDNRHARATAREQREQSKLCEINILELIDDNVLKARGECTFAARSFK